MESTVQEAKAGIYKDISEAARGVTSEVAGVSRQVEGVGKEVLNNRFATERGLCDLILVIRLILISGILVIKWEQGSIGLWIVFARWNINSQIAAVKLRA